MVFYTSLAEKEDRMGNLYRVKLISNAVFSLQDSCFYTVHKNYIFKMTNNDSKVKGDM